jgi:hypothetical protein
MEDRGLIVTNTEFALGKLRDLNYYRLRGYWLTLEDGNRFVKGTTFDDVWKIYQLDCELREWVWKAIAADDMPHLPLSFAWRLTASRSHHRSSIISNWTDLDLTRG